MKSLIIYTLLLTLFAPLFVFAENITVSQVSRPADIIPGKLYYRIYRDEQNIYLDIINAFEANIFVEKNTLKITDVYVQSSQDPPPTFRALKGGWGSSHPDAEFFLLRYVSHPTGGACPCQLTSLGFRPYKYKSLDDNVSVSSTLKAFIGSKNAYVNFVIRHDSKISEISTIQKQPEEK